MTSNVRQRLFAILQKYEFSSKSQLRGQFRTATHRCLRYCKSTSFQANHNALQGCAALAIVVCDTAKVRVFKQITTINTTIQPKPLLFAILQKYEFSSKSQQKPPSQRSPLCCLRYCKSTSFQANHNAWSMPFTLLSLFAILQKYEFSSKSQHALSCALPPNVVCDTAKVRVFKQITTCSVALNSSVCCLRYCKSTSFQANHNYMPPRFFGGLLFAILQKYEFSSKSQQCD